MRAERTRVDTPPTGGPNTLVFLHGAEYTRGTRCPLAELHWLLITATITRVVSYRKAVVRSVAICRPPDTIRGGTSVKCNVRFSLFTLGTDMEGPKIRRSISSKQE